MDITAEVADAHTKTYPLGPLIIEGKTKFIHAVKGKPGLAIVISKDDLTAGDGARHERLLGKGNLANQTTCNVFELLQDCNLPVAFVAQDSVNSFIARRCRMIPLEVVVRGLAAGSYLKRHPNVGRGARFTTPAVEFYLKTKGREWRGVPLPCDDPLLIPDERGDQYLLYEPGKPVDQQVPCRVLDAEELFYCERDAHLLPEMAEYALAAFQVLDWAWGQLNFQLVDFKVEFGIDADGELLIADVIDNDSWRLLYNGQHVDKQLFRDGRSLDEVAEAYRFVAEMSKQLPALNQLAD